MTPEDSREELEEKLRDAAFESEDSKSFLSATQVDKVDLMAFLKSEN